MKRLVAILFLFVGFALMLLGAVFVFRIHVVAFPRQRSTLRLYLAYCAQLGAYPRGLGNQAVGTLPLAVRRGWPGGRAMRRLTWLNKITGANAGGPRRLAIPSLWAARIAQFWR